MPINKTTYLNLFINLIFFCLIVIGNKSYSNDFLSQVKAECKKGNGQNCFMIANAIKKENISQAIQYYKMSCDYKFGEACFNLGQKYMSGEGVKKDINKALNLYQKAFDFNHPVAYVELGRLYLNGEIVTKDLKKAKSYLKKACDAGEKYTACLMVKEVDNSYTKEDDYRAIERMKKICNGKSISGVALTCGTIANLYKKYNDFDNAIKYYKKACGVFSSECISLGEIYINKKYNGYNEDKAISYFEEVCEKGKGEGCIKAGEVYKNLKNDSRKSEIYFKKACSLGYVNYCIQ